MDLGQYNSLLVILKFLFADNKAPTGVKQKEKKQLDIVQFRVYPSYPSNFRPKNNA